MPVTASPAAREWHLCLTLLPGQGPKAPGPRAGSGPALPVGITPQSTNTGLRAAIQGQRSLVSPRGAGTQEEFSRGSLEVSSGDAWDKQSPATGQSLRAGACPCAHPSQTAPVMQPQHPQAPS